MQQYHSERVIQDGENNTLIYIQAAVQARHSILMTHSHRQEKKLGHTHTALNAPTEMWW